MTARRVVNLVTVMISFSFLLYSTLMGKTSSSLRPLSMVSLVYEIPIFIGHHSLLAIY